MKKGPTPIERTPENLLLLKILKEQNQKDPPPTLERLHLTLKKARHKIRLKRNWTQDELARDKHNNPVDPRSKTACKWCAMGAIEAITPNKTIHRDLESFLREIVEYDSGYMGKDRDTADMPTLSSLNYFNDEYATHEDIIKVFDKGIDRLERKMQNKESKK